VLSDQEERIWNDVLRHWDDTAAEPGDPDDAPLWAMLGVRAAVVLLLFGAVVPGLVVTAASLTGWALWCARRTEVSAAGRTGRARAASRP
jgi:hypothetical protein